MVTTRPQSLLALLDLIKGIKITPTEFVNLFENPLLAYGVSQAWDDVQALLDSGIVLSGKSIARLRWDLSQELHQKIAVSAEADQEPEAADHSVGDTEYFDLLKSAASRGYRRIPELDLLAKELEKAKHDVRAKTEAFDKLSSKYEELGKTITHFGKRKQRYLRKIAHR